MRKILKTALLATLIAATGFTGAEMDPELLGEAEQVREIVKDRPDRISFVGRGVRGHEITLLQSLKNKFDDRKRYTTVRR